MSIRLPSTLAKKYRVESALGSGGFGSIFLATQTALDRKVVLKLLIDGGLNPEQTPRFQMEALLTASLVHPHIVVVIDHGVDDGIPWIVYEYLPGMNLTKALAGGAFTWRAALKITDQVAAALEAAHAKGILHRDLKPDNMVEIAPEQYKLIDFGLAKWLEDVASLTRTGCVVGTPIYMAPEVIRGEPAGPGADLYALGLICAEMLTGATTHSRGPRKDGIPGNLSEDLTLRSQGAHWPPGVVELVMRCVTDTPEERIASASQVRDGIKTILSGASRIVRPRSSGPVRISSRPTGQRSFSVSGSHQAVSQRRPYAALGAVLVLGLAAVGYLLWSKRPASTAVLASTASASAAAIPDVAAKLMEATAACSVIHKQDWPIWEHILEKRQVFSGDYEGAKELALPLIPRHRKMKVVMDEAMSVLGKHYSSAKEAPDAVLVAWCETTVAAFRNWWVLTDCELTVNWYGKNDARNPGGFGQGKKLRWWDTGGSTSDTRSWFEEEKRGLALFWSFQEAALESLDRLAARETTDGAWVAILMENLRQMARAVIFWDWTPAAQEQVTRRIGIMKNHIGHLPGPRGPVLAPLALGCWNWGVTGTMRKTGRTNLSQTLEQMRSFATTLRDGQQEVQTFVRQMEHELEDKPTKPTPTGSPGFELGW